ncbi:CU044_5270 family protein [Actinomadura harenae]|uniref:CU044_5270 family protein n=1 Tax=Actinomadura harenae TaxID=2483351 RepID=A0A3M2LHH2_9ACTN|nr:CU044_5270 family protein [Actinomadura harenae]RMI36929.1 hypothetical protein EBO15_37295 [Actinomadura harenae]
MDDDLRVLADTLAKPEPSQDAVDRRRHELQNAMRGGSGPARARRRISWALAGTGLTAGVAAAAVTVALATGSIGRSPHHGGPSAHDAGPSATGTAAPMTARQVFLAAAETASHGPERIGRYWHLGTLTTDAQGALVKGQSFDRWFRHDGRHYTSGLKTDWKPFFPPKQDPGFRIGGPVMSFDELRALPDAPAPLVARLTRAVENAHIRTSAGELNAQDRRYQVLGDLFVLSTQSPVTQKVRAAAFRALANAPEVKSLGRVKGGVRLNLPLAGDPQGTEVVLDPETGRLRNSRTYIDFQGGIFFAGADGETVSITAEWTDTLPEKTGPK